MLKETETEERRLFCYIVIIGGILIWGLGRAPWLRLWVEVNCYRKMVKIDGYAY